VGVLARRGLRGSSSFVVVVLQLWRTFLLTPFKLITVFLHETSHALACKLTCGDVSQTPARSSTRFGENFQLAVMAWHCEFAIEVAAIEVRLGWRWGRIMFRPSSRAGRWEK
jgi:hypothetical protein